MLRKLCAAPGCDALAEPGGARCAPCDDRARAARSAARAQAKTGATARSGSRLYGHKWRKARAAFLSRHPTCVDCASVGLVTAATEVDHITPHRGDRGLFWSRGNWQPLCKSCHSRKTAGEVWHTGGVQK